MTPREYLASLEFFGIKLGLDNIRALLEAADSPERAYPSVHVAGTNGKGSVVAIIDAILQAAGYRTGRFTSPHLRDLRERFLVNSALIGDRELDEHIEYFRRHVERMPNPPTFFELNTAIAFRHFAQEKVDIAIIEVGMGGRFDSTNVLDPAATAITNISLEHTKYLGDTIEAIAFEKAGILKPHRPAVLGEMDRRAREVIVARANELACPIYESPAQFSYDLTGDAFAQRLSWQGARFSIDRAPFALRGRYQGQNGAVAVALAELLSTQFPRIDAEAVQRGLANAKWPCRLEKVLEDPPVIIDVAHNEGGMIELARALERPCDFVLAIASDKNAAAMIAALDGVTHSLILTRFQDRRAMSLDALRIAAGSREFTVVDNLPAAIQLAMARRTEGVPIVIAGSLFAAGEAHAILDERYGTGPLRF